MQPLTLDQWASVATIAAAGATVVAAVAAVWTLRAWRGQLRGTERYRVARACIRAIIVLRDNFDAAREPIMSGDVSENRAYLDRLKRVLRMLASLRSLRPESEMLWGVDAVQRVDALTDLYKELLGATHAYAEKKVQAHHGRADLADGIGENRAVMYRPLRRGDPDPFGDKVAAAVREALTYFEQQARP